MSTLLVYSFLSIPLIGAFVLFSLGIVVIFRASRVLNLAHGAMAMFPAYAYYSLTSHGTPVVIAVALAVLVGAALGVVVEWAFVRRLRAQGSTAQTVGTVAVTGLLIAVVGKIYGTAPIQAPHVFPESTLTIGGAAIRFGQIALLVIGMSVAAAMFAFFRYTEFGLAMRAAAQNRTAAVLMGVDPNQAASAAWAMGGGLAALAGVLLASVTNLNPYTLSLQVLPAFVAVLIGGMESLPGAVVGSVIAGLAFGLVPAAARWPGFGAVLGLSGSSNLSLTVLAVIVMLRRGRRFSGTDTSESGFTSGAQVVRTRNKPRPGPVVLLVVLALAAWPWLVPFSVLGSTLLALEFAFVAVSLVVLIGWVGQISLAQATFVGIGALLTAMVARGWGLGFPFNVAVGTLTAAAAATALGAVALRVRGLYLAVATLIFAWMADAFLFPSPWLGITGGSSTIPNQHIGNPHEFPSFDFTSRRTLYFVMVVILLLVVLGMANIRDTRTGRAFFAIRGSELAAASLGIDIVRYKLAAFAISGALAGLGGGLLMVEQRTVVPDQFLFTASLQYLAIAVVGGLSSLSGAIAASVLFAGLNELFFRVSALSGYLDLVSALLLALVLLAYPGGLAALGRAAARWSAVITHRTAAFVGPVATWVHRVDTALRPITDRLRLRRPAVNDARGAKARSRIDWYAAARGGLSAEAEIPAQAAPEGFATPGESTDIATRLTLASLREAREALVQATDVTVTFGGLKAVSDASLTVREHEIVGLIGPNGAGKTTLFNAILGLNEPSSGVIRLYGQDVTQLPPHERAKLGVARTFQVLQLFSDLSVHDNLLVATHLHNESGVLGNMTASRRTIGAERAARARVRDILGLLGLDDLRDHPVRGLPFGTLRMIELGRALVTGARLLMLDEAASGLNDAETERLVGVVRSVRNLGVSVLLIEHDVQMVTGVSDYVYVLEQGRVLAEGGPDEIQRDPAVIAAYLGAAADAEQTPAPRHTRAGKSRAAVATIEAVG
jgi:sulfate-transporting ATPase